MGLCLSRSVGTRYVDMASHYTKEFKQSVILGYANGKSLRALERETGASYSTIRSWCVPGDLEKRRVVAESHRKNPENKDKRKAYQQAWYAKNRGKKIKQNSEWKERNPIRFWACMALAAARTRAKKKLVPFDLKVDDILCVFPGDGKCPILKTTLSLQQGYVGRPNSPSLDRVVPHLGYVPGNIAVISNRANMIKSNANASELRSVANWVESFLKG